MKQFTGLDMYSLHWSFEQNGRIVKQGFISSPAVKPRASRKYLIDLSGVDKSLGGELTVKLVQNLATEWADTNYEVGFEQISFAPSAIDRPSLEALIPADKFVTLDDDGSFIRVTASDTVYTFNKLEGAICSIKDNGKEMLASSITPTVWRAPTDNDRRIVEQWKKARYHRALVDCRDFEIVAVTDKKAVLRAELSMGAAAYRPVMYVTVTYTVLAQGGVIISTHAEKSGFHFGAESPELPRFGFEFKMPEHNEKIVYYGRGSGESYEDLRHSSRLGIYETTATENFEHYIKPQENSAHVDTRWVSVSDLMGHGLMALCTDKTFSFNCCHYTVNQLFETKHDHELIPEKETVVHIDYRNAGIGSHSCGPVLDRRFAITEDIIDFSFRLLPSILCDTDASKEYGMTN